VIGEASVQNDEGYVDEDTEPPAKRHRGENGITKEKSAKPSEGKSSHPILSKKQSWPELADTTAKAPVAEFISPANDEINDMNEIELEQTLRAALAYIEKLKQDLAEAGNPTSPWDTVNE
jgi:hypothetical protein